MGVTILRTIIMYIVVVSVLRVMGKRQIGELEASELVVTIIISDIAAMPITNSEVPLISNIAAIIILMVLEVILSYFAFKKPLIRQILYGRPSMFFSDGKFNQEEMLKQRFNIADVMEELRGKGITSLDEVEYIVMETNGNVSVVLKSENDVLTPKDMKIKKENIRMNYIIIDNGNIIYDCLYKLGLDEAWLNKTLRKNGYKSYNDVFYLSYEIKTKKVIIIPKQR